MGNNKIPKTKPILVLYFKLPINDIAGAAKCLKLVIRLYCGVKVSLKSETV